MDYEYGINTKLVHAGERPSPDTSALAPPIYQTSSFAIDEILPSGIKRGKGRLLPAFKSHAYYARTKDGGP